MGKVQSGNDIEGAIKTVKGRLKGLDIASGTGTKKK